MCIIFPYEGEFKFKWAREEAGTLPNKMCMTRNESTKE